MGKRERKCRITLKLMEEAYGYLDDAGSVIEQDIKMDPSGGNRMGSRN